MQELLNERGLVCASICLMPLDGRAWALAVSWEEGVGGLPEARAWNQAIEASMRACREEGAIVLESRVMTALEGADDALLFSRAALHRDSLKAWGFTQCEGRVEYRAALDEALASLESRAIPPRLAWSCIDPGSEKELVRAAELFRQAMEGDPSAHPDDDALGFLREMLEREDSAQAPERLQAGTHQGVPAAVLALMAFPADGWCTIYFLGILPAFRGLGLGAEAMLHGLRSLKSMGGATYRDGTGTGNAGARALFAHLGRPPFQTMETWRLEA